MDSTYRDLCALINIAVDVPVMLAERLVLISTCGSGEGTENSAGLKKHSQWWSETGKNPGHCFGNSGEERRAAKTKNTMSAVQDILELTMNTFYITAHVLESW